MNSIRGDPVLTVGAPRDPEFAPNGIEDALANI
jgi:hypothetical protein